MRSPMLGFARTGVKAGNQSAKQAVNQAATHAATRALDLWNASAWRFAPRDRQGDHHDQ